MTGNVNSVYNIKKKINLSTYPVFFFKFKDVARQDVMVRTVLFLAHKTVKQVAVIS